MLELRQNMWCPVAGAERLGRGQSNQIASSLKLGDGGHADSGSTALGPVNRQPGCRTAVHKQPDRRGGSVVALLCTGKLTTGAILLLQCHHAFTAWWQRTAVLCFAVQFAAPKPPLGDADFSDLMVGEDPATRKAALKAQLANLKEVRPLQAACLCTDSS